MGSKMGKGNRLAPMGPALRALGEEIELRAKRAKLKVMERCTKGTMFLVFGKVMANLLYREKKHS